MQTNPVISMLGLARRAGKLSIGHDAAQNSLFKNKAKLLFFCSDISPGRISEFEKTIKLHNFTVTVIKSAVTMDELYFQIGCKAGVLTVDDENIASKIISLSRENKDNQ